MKVAKILNLAFLHLSSQKNLNVGKNQHKAGLTRILLTNEFIMIQGRFKVIEELSKGSTSCCFLCEDVVESRKVVLKVIPRDSKTGYSKENFQNEIEMLELCRGPFVIRVLDSMTTKEEYIIEMEPGVDDLLNEISRHGPLSEKRVRRYFHGVSLALKEMHNKHIVHNDIKLENMVITRDDKIKLIDFGLSEKLDINTGKSKMTRGTFRYLAPEMMMMFKGHDTKSDIWSLGVSLFAALSNDFPFEGDDEYVYSMNAIQMPPRMELLERANVSKSLINLIGKMLEKDPLKRISIDEVVKFDWL